MLTVRAAAFSTLPEWVTTAGWGAGSDALCFSARWPHPPAHTPATTSAHRIALPHPARRSRRPEPSRTALATSAQVGGAGSAFRGLWFRSLVFISFSPPAASGFARRGGSPVSARRARGRRPPPRDGPGGASAGGIHQGAGHTSNALRGWNLTH